MCDEIINTTKIILTKTVSKKKAIQKTSIFFYILVTIAVLIAVTIYCYLIKYQTNKKNKLFTTISHTN